MFITVSHPVGEQFSAPPLPEHAIDAGSHSLVSTHLVAHGDSVSVVTLWRATVDEPETEPAT